MTLHAASLCCCSWQNTSLGAPKNRDTCKGARRSNNLQSHPCGATRLLLPPGESGFTNCRVSRIRQFGAVLHKNYLLQTRTSRAHTYLGAAGWAALLIEIAIPAVFFTLMCIPKHYLNPMKFPQQVSQAWDLDATQWALQYEGGPLQGAHCSGDLNLRPLFILDVSSCRPSPRARASGAAAVRPKLDGRSSGDGRVCALGVLPR